MPASCFSILMIKEDHLIAVNIGEPNLIMRKYQIINKHSRSVKSHEKLKFLTDHSLSITLCEKK